MGGHRYGVSCSHLRRNGASCYRERQEWPIRKCGNARAEVNLSAEMVEVKLAPMEVQSRQYELPSMLTRTPA